MSGLSPTLSRAALLGVVSASLMMASVLQRHEIWNSRTLSLVFIWSMGGFLGAYSTVAAMRLASRFGRIRHLRLIRAILFLPAFLVAGAVVFCLLTRWQNGLELHPEYPIRWMLLGSLQLMALFIYSVSQYMLPWMAPALMIAAYTWLPNLPPPPEA
jgi:hypothetical protein